MPAELDTRTFDGGIGTVTLMWHGGTACTVEVRDGLIEFDFPIAGARALDAFHHPYAYVPADILGAARHDADAIDAVRREHANDPDTDDNREVSFA